MIFKDEALWKAFNHEACAGRNWLPGNFDENGDVKQDIQPETSNYLLSAAPKLLMSPAA